MTGTASPVVTAAATGPLSLAASAIAVFLLLAALVPPAGAVVLPPDVAQQLEQRVDAFVDAPGYARFDVDALLDDDWYGRFDRAGQSALPPDADLDPVTRGMLLFTRQEATLETARYRITRHQRALDGDWSDVRHAYIEITRYNLAPGLHRMNVETYGEYAAPPGPELELPHVSWRLVTTGLMGQRAAVVAASRRVVEPVEASRATCLEKLPCLAMDGAGFEPGRFESIPAPATAPAVYRDAMTPPGQPEFAIATPVRIAQELFGIAAGDYDELHEAATLEHPEMVVAIDFGIAGQERNSRALMHLTSLMDDALSERWIRRLEVPGSVEWQRSDVAHPRGQ